MAEPDEKARAEPEIGKLARVSDKRHRRLIAVMEVVMLIGLAGAVYERQWFNAFLILCIILLTALPALLARKFAVRLPSEFHLLAVVFIFSALFLGDIRGYYDRFWWWDVLLHTSSGVLVGIAGFLLVFVLNRHEEITVHLKPGFVALFSFALAMTVGTVWEIFEFGMDNFFGLNMQRTGLVDTMWDLIVDAVGALVIALLGYFYIRSEHEYFLELWIRRFIVANPRLFGRQ